MRKIDKTLRWWFTAGDKLLEMHGVPNNAGNIKFRGNMRIFWFVFWAMLAGLAPGYCSLAPCAMVLWGAAAWYKPFFK